MKKLWLGIFILAGLCAVGTGVLGVLHAKSGETLSYLAKARNARMEGDTGRAVYLSDCALECWEKNAGFMDIVMSHEETDEIKREFADLLVYAGSELPEEFYASCGKLIVMVSHLEKMEKPVLRNLL